MTPGFPPVLGIDEDWSKADPAALATAGYRFAIGYVSEDDTGKNISRAQVDALHAAGLDVGLVYEYTVMAALGGTSRGGRDASIAINHAQQLGTPAGVCLYAAVDWNVTPDQMPAVLAYANQFQASCGPMGYRAGIYGSYAVCAYLAMHGYTGLLWQTYAWSGGQWWPGAAVQQQQNGIYVAGATVDRDAAETPDWGQWRATMALTQEDCANVARLVLEGIMWDGHLSDPGADAYFAKLNVKAMLTGLAPAPAAVDTHALATELVTELEAAGILTADGAHTVLKAVLDAKLAAAQAA